jgi:TctA family transporter
LSHVFDLGSASIFWSNGLVTTMMGLGLLLLVLPLLSLIANRSRSALRKPVEIA